MTATVLFFASLRDQIGISRIEVSISTPVTALSIWQQVTGKEILSSTVRIARNHAYCEAMTLIESGDELAFFPPVTGG